MARLLRCGCDCPRRILQILRASKIYAKGQESASNTGSAIVQVNDV
jgi:hypothetical protein